MRIGLDVLQVLLDATTSSLRFKDQTGLYKFAYGTRQEVVNLVLTAMKEEGIQIGGDEPDGPKGIEPNLVSTQIVSIDEHSPTRRTLHKALFYNSDLVGFYDGYERSKLVDGEITGLTPLYQWERTEMTYPGKGIDIQRGRTIQEESRDEGEIIHKMLAHKFGVIEIKE